MNDTKKKQLKIAKKIARKGHCDNFSCMKYRKNQAEPICGFWRNGCGGWANQGVDAASDYIKKHSRVSTKELMKRIEKLEEKVSEQDDKVDELINLLISWLGGETQDD